jgi:hypothetical protein
MGRIPGFRWVGKSGRGQMGSLRSEGPGPFLMTAVEALALRNTLRERGTTFLMNVDVFLYACEYRVVNADKRTGVHALTKLASGRTLNHFRKATQRLSS